MLGNSAGLWSARHRSRPWIVRVLGLLILLQAVAYVALSVSLLLPFDWGATAGHRVDLISPEQSGALSVSIILIPAAILAVSATIGFFSLFRTGWVLAMATQGATLLGCLILYLGTKPPAIFPAILFSIIMAFYLKSFEVRRRWDDPELEKAGEHPVIYAGAGSHASYFTAGEYLTEPELPFLSPLVALADKHHEFWHRRLRQCVGPEVESGQGDRTNILFVPFVDYARRDGLAIGPGQDREWAPPRILSQVPGWVACYRGLWGLYAHDLFSGEDASAGPMYNRDGSVRRAWYDPVGWAGLDKEPPPGVARDMVVARQEALGAPDWELQARIDEKSRELMGLGLESAATRGEPHLAPRHRPIKRASATLLRKWISSGRSRPWARH